MEEQTDLEEIKNALEECKERDITIWIDNDHIGVRDPDKDYEPILAVHPYRLMEVLLELYGIKYEHV